LCNLAATNILSMKLALTAFLLFFSASLTVGQTMCKSLRFADKAINSQFDFPYWKFKKYNDASFIPDAVMQQIEKSTAKETSRAFFKMLTVKKVYLCDSFVYNRIVADPNRMIDDEGNKVSYVYTFLYELKLNDSVPFQFRVDYNKDGGLIRKAQLASIDRKRFRVIDCDKAISVALADATEPIHGVDIFYLVADPIHKTVVYQINSVMDPETNLVYIKYVNAYSGKLTGRENYKVELQVLEETKIGPLKIEN
jgi:hypothetical protein